MNKTAARNLRIREDTAVYLKDLSEKNEIDYDGKSRTLTNERKKISTDMKKMREQETFAYKVTMDNNIPIDLNPVSDPS